MSETSCYGDRYASHEWKLWTECDNYDVLKCMRCGLERRANQAEGREALRDECHRLQDDRKAAVAVLAEFVAWFGQWKTLPYSVIATACRPIIDRAEAIIEKGSPS